MQAGRRGNADEEARDRLGAPGIFYRIFGALAIMWYHRRAVYTWPLDLLSRVFAFRGGYHPEASRGEDRPPMPVRLGPLWCPLASGEALRFFPWALYRPLLRHEAKRSGYLHVYLHPWEFSARSRDLAGLTLEMRLYFTLGRRGARAELRRSLREFAFASVAERLESIRRNATATRSFDDITCYRVPKSGLLQRWRPGAPSTPHSSRRPGHVEGPGRVRAGRRTP